MSRYAQHYITLNDESLVALALRDELADDAKEALIEELERRGISDLAAKQKVREKEYAAEEATRQNIVSIKMKFIGWGIKCIYALGLLLIAYDLLRLTVPSITDHHDDAGLVLVMGVGFLLFGAILSRAYRIWIKHILHRKLPRV